VHPGSGFQPLAGCGEDNAASGIKLLFALATEQRLSAACRMGESICNKRPVVAVSLPDILAMKNSLYAF
jgi:hypothetical protein